MSFENLARYFPRRCFFLIALFSLIVGCGGGGGNAVNVNNPPQVTADGGSTATPTVGTPTVGTPTVGTPTVGTPTVGTPTVGTPTVSTPTVSTPTVSTVDPLVRPLAPLPPANSSAPLTAWLRTNSEKYEFLTNGELIFAETFNAPMSLHTSNGLYISVGIVDQMTGSTQFALNIYPANGVQNLRAGDIVSATGFGSFSVSTNGKSCNRTHSVFYVNEIERDSINNITRLALDFSFNCTGNPKDLVEGAVRFRSAVPILTTTMYAITDKSMTVLEGRPLNIDATLSWTPSEKISNYIWHQISGPSLDLSKCNGSSSCATYSPKVPFGGAQAVVEFTMITESGRLKTNQIPIGIRSHLDRQSRYEVSGNGYLASSSLYFGNEKNGVFGFPKNWSQSPESLAVQYNEQIAGGYSGSFQSSFNLSFTKGQALSPGYFSTGGTASFEPENYLGFDLTNEYRNCNGIAEGYISIVDRNVLDLTKINSFGMWYRRTCQALGVLEPEPSFGVIWINYLPTGSPTARIDGHITASPGSTVILSGRKSSDANGFIQWYSWYSLYGSVVDFVASQDGADLLVSFSSASKSGEKIVISLEVIDNQGNTSVELHTITIQ